MALRTREISQAWAQAWVPSAQGVDVSPNSHWLPGHLPFHQDEDPLGWPQVWGPRRANTGFIPLPHCQGTFNFNGSNMFFVCVLFLKDSLFLISSWKTGMSRAARRSQDWDHEKEHLLGFLSVTPFSDLLLKGNLFSYAPLTQGTQVSSETRVPYLQKCMFVYLHTKQL